MKGYIQIHRSLLDHWIIQNGEDTHKWIIMLLQVNHAEGKISLGNTLYKIQRGQSANSYATWAKFFGCHKNTIKPFFDKLASDKMISYKTLGSGKYSTTLVTITNYEKYQSPPDNLTNSSDLKIVTQDVSLDVSQRKREVCTNNNKKEEKYKDGLIELIAVFNTLLGSTYRYSSSLLKNYSLCLETYSLDEMKQAIENYDSDFWAKDISITWFLKCTNKAGDAVDYIGDLLNYKSSMSKAQKNRQL